MKLTLWPLKRDRIIRARCDGPLTFLDRDPLRDLLGPDCSSYPLLLSLEGATAIDASGISWLIRSHKACEEAGGKLVLFAVPPVLLTVLNFLRLLPLFNLSADESAATELALKPRLFAPAEAASAHAEARAPARQVG